MHRGAGPAKSDMFTRWKNSLPKNNVAPKFEKLIQCRMCPTAYKRGVVHKCKEKDKFKRPKK